VRFVDIPRAGTHAPLLVSGSWDRTLCYWDLRQPQPIGRISLSERVYAMDASGPLLAAATPDRQIHLVHLDGGNPLAVSKKLQSQLVHQPSCIAVSADGSHWAAGSIEGRVDTRAVDEKEGQ
jgi:mRNA export factor